MEVVGLTFSAVAIATLFNTCVECFETFSRGRNLEKDLVYLLIRLDFEKTQLLLWGNSTGILKVEQEERNAGLTDSTICKLVEDTLQAIQILLSDASELRQRYGVIHSETAAETKQWDSADILSSNSMSVFRTSWIRFCSRAARALPKRGASSTIARARWSIHDRSKFTELLETLSTLIEKLHKVIPIQDFRYAELEGDLAGIVEVSQLRLVEAALKYSSNAMAKDLAKAATVIISNSELGTSDRRTIVDWLQNTQSIDKPDWIDDSSVPAQRGERLNLEKRLDFLGVNTKKSLYFVNTPDCSRLTASTPCPDIPAAERLPSKDKDDFTGVGKKSLRTLFPNLAKPPNFYPSGYTDMIDNSQMGPYELQEHIARRIMHMLPFGVIYIHTSPCQWAIQTAIRVASALENEEIAAVVRIDERISSSCFRSAADRHVVLQSMLDELDAQELTIHNPWTKLDRLWLDQRIFSLENESGAHSSRTSQMLDIFLQESYPDPFAGLVVVGEVDFCTPLLQADPFPWLPRIPRELEVYEVTRAGSGYIRKYVSKFPRRWSPMNAKTILPQRPTSGTLSVLTEVAELQANKQSTSPSASEGQEEA